MDLKNLEEYVKRSVRQALEEDIGTGDITTLAVIPGDMRSVASIVAKEDCVVCGLGVAKAVFSGIDPVTEFSAEVSDGDTVKTGQVLARIRGSARALLEGERTALNYLQRLSGIATKAREFVDKTKAYNVKILDTRKTTPGLRMLEKYAVKTGGASNHRMGLSDAILIKDNHIKLVGIENAIARARKTGKSVEVEVSSLEELETSLRLGADIIMLDNMKLEDIRRSVSLINRRALVEVSGGVDENNIVEIAKLGADWISIGKLTHSVRSVEIGMEIEKE